MQEPSEEKRLEPTKIKILYFLHTHRDFRGSKVQLRKMMGYPSDGSINPHLNELIDDDYLKEEQTKSGMAYRLTKKGRDGIFFLRLPDYLLLAIGIIGVLDLYLAFDNLVLGVPLSPNTTLITGAALIAMYLLIRSVQKRVTNRFLDMREPLEESESSPRDGREDVSSS